MTRIVLLAALLVTTAEVRAQSISAQAQALFKQGKELMAAKKFAEACDAVAASNQISPSIVTLLNHADCREKNAQLVTAWGLFNDVERQTRSGTDAASKTMNSTATTRAKKLEPRMSKLTIKVTTTSGLEIARNGERVDPSTWNLALPVDGGTYAIVARAPNTKDWSSSITIATEGDTKVVEVPALEPVKIDRPVEVGVVTPVTPVMPPPQADTRGGRSLVMPIVFGGAAIALGATAFGFSRWGDSIYEDAEKEVDDDKQERLWKSANKRRYAAQGLAIGAVGCIAAAVVFYVRGGSSEESTTARSVTVSPTASADAMGMTIAGSW